MANLENLVKGLVRVVSLCSCEESAASGETLSHRKALKEQMMLQSLELIGTLKNIIILEFSSHEIASQVGQTFSS